MPTAQHYYKSTLTILICKLLSFLVGNISLHSEQITKGVNGATRNTKITNLSIQVRLVAN